MPVSASSIPPASDDRRSTSWTTSFGVLTELRGLSLTRLGAWGAKFGSAVLDQGVYSGGNMVLNVLLARWLDQGSYGAFAVVFTGFLIISGFHNALIIEPMSVLGPARYPDRPLEYFISQVKLQWVVVAILAALLLTAEISIGLRSDDPLWQSILGGGIALPLMLLLLMCRRLFYLVQRPTGAFVGSVSYFLFAVFGLAAARRLGQANPFAAFLTMGLASLVASGLLLWLAGATRIRWVGRTVPQCAQLWKEDWEYGRWLVASNVLYSGATQVQTFMAAGFLGLEAAGALRAMQLPVNAFVQAMTAVVALGLPILSYEFGRKNMLALHRKGLFLTAGLTVVALSYEIILGAACGPLEHLLYGGKFAAYAYLVPMLGLAAVFGACTSGFLLVLRAAQRPQYSLLINAVNAPAGVISGVVFTWLWGIGGTVSSMVLVSAVSMVMTFYLYRRHRLEL